MKKNKEPIHVVEAWINYRPLVQIIFLCFEILNAVKSDDSDQLQHI